MQPSFAVMFSSRYVVLFNGACRRFAGSNGYGLLQLDGNSISVEERINAVKKHHNDPDGKLLNKIRYNAARSLQCVIYVLFIVESCSIEVLNSQRCSIEFLFKSFRIAYYFY